MNYLKLFEDGSTEATAELPTWGEISTTGDYYIDGLWYDKTGVLYTNQFTYLSNKGKLAGIEVANGIPVDIHYTELAPTLVEDTIKATDIIADEFIGKNACTAWVNFDGATTPPTIRDSFNVSDVVRVGTATFDIYITDIDNNNYSVSGGSSANIGYSPQLMNINQGRYPNSTVAPTTEKFRVTTVRASDGLGIEESYNSVAVFGGKN